MQRSPNARQLRLRRSSAIVDVDQDLVRSTTCLGRVALARVVAAGRQWVRARSNVSAVGRGVTAVAFLVILGTAVGQAAVGASGQTVRDCHVRGAAGGALDGGQEATVGVVDVAAHEVPGAVAGAREEGLLPSAVNGHRESISGAAILRAVSCASHVAVASRSCGGWKGVSTPALVGILGSGVLVA